MVTETKMIRKVLEDFEIKEVSDRVLEFVGSTEMVDRDGEVIRMSGWQLKNYRKNPVFMWAHDYRSPPIGKTNLVHTDAKGLVFQVEFADAETYAFADTIYKLYKAGFLKATSVGFIPLEWEDGKDDKLPRRTYKKQELLELSGVPVPANPEALRLAQDQGLITAKEFDAFWEPVITASDDAVTKPEETETTIRIPVPGEEGKHTDHKRRVIPVSEEKGIQGLYCVDCKKIIIYIFDKEKGWTMESAQAWVDDHTEAQEPEETKEAIPSKRTFDQETIKDELDYLLEAISESGLAESTEPLAWKLVESIFAEAGSDIPVDIAAKVGAVLNAKNKQALKDAQGLIQTVLDSAAPEPQEESIDLKITTDQLITYIREALAELHQPVPSKAEVLDLVRGIVQAEIAKRNQ